MTFSTTLNTVRPLRNKTRGGFMEISGIYLTEMVIRWLHVVAGILWIGLLYFFNFVNANFTKTLDADSKKKVVPELMPRALFFFRWA
ncbi:MAG TPA: urate hydroxylase PuuD, partial [bacterium]|nr:urate hydroxylase PuuD [bacterium]